MYQVLFYKRLLDESSEKLKAHFKDHPGIRVNVLQKPEKFREDYDLYKPQAIVLDYPMAMEKKQALVGRLKKISEALDIFVLIPDFIGDAALGPLRSNPAISFLIPSSAGMIEMELYFRNMSRRLDLYGQYLDFRGKYESIIGEFTTYRETLSQKDQRIEELTKKIGEIIIYDELTNLYNERYFNNQVKITLEECRRYKENVCLIYVDIDNREQIEEVYGKEGIHFVLQQTGAAIKKSVRNNDLVAIRDDHGYYMVLYKKIRVESVRVVVGRLKRLLEDHIFLYNQKQIRITAAIGLASTINYVANTYEFEDLRNQTKIAFENAIKKGGNILVAYA